MFRFLARPFAVAMATLAIAGAALSAPLRVAATFTIPADFARRVGGDSVAVSSITPPNSDLHSIQPTPAQVRDLAAADLVVAIHPELEPWIAKVEASGALRRPVLYLAKDILKDGVFDDDEDGPGSVAASAEHDPHAWMDPELSGIMAGKLADRLSALDPAKAVAYRTAGRAFALRMKTLANDITRELTGIPASRRKLISQHDNLRRFAKKFRFEVVGTLLESSSTEGADPSARRMIDLIRKIHDDNIPAIFSDKMLSQDLPEAIAREAGLPPPVPLMIDALDLPGTPAGTYEGMMRENARRIAVALTPPVAQEKTW